MNGVWIAIIPTCFISCLVSFQEMKPLADDWKNILPLLITMLIMTALCVFMFKIELKIALLRWIYNPAVVISNKIELKIKR